MNKPAMFSRGLLLTVLALALSACGGGGDGESGNSQASIAGVYGRDTSWPMIVAADGRFVGYAGGFMGQIAGTHTVVFSGILTTNGTAWVAPDASVGHTFSALTLAPTTTVKPSRAEGTFVEGVSIYRDIGLPIVLAHPTTLNFFVDPVYRSASLATIAGSYTVPTGNLSVSSAGAIQGSYDTDCAIGGNVRVLVADRNVYSITATLTGSGCPGGSGRTHEMLGYLASQPSPQLVVKADIDGKQSGFFASRNP